KKFVFRPGRGQATAFARIETVPEPRTKGPFNLTMGAGFSSNSENGQPVQLVLDLDPAFFLYYANHRDLVYSMKDGILTATSTNSTDGASSRFQMEAATGRLLQLTYSLGAPELIAVEMHTKAGAYARLLREISTTTATHTNEYVPNHGFSSWLA